MGRFTPLPKVPPLREGNLKERRFGPPCTLGELQEGVILLGEQL